MTSLWIDAIKGLRPHGITFDVLYHSLPESQRSRKFARRFSQAFAKATGESGFIVAITDILDDTKMARFDRIADAMRLAKEKSPHGAFWELSVVIFAKAAESITARVTSEIQNLLLLHCIPEKRRERFTERLRLTFARDDKALEEMCLFAGSGNEQLASIALFTRGLLKARSVFTEALSTGVLVFGDRLLKLCTDTVSALLSESDFSERKKHD